jgi:AcrR family transcriptional regulator
VSDDAATKERLIDAASALFAEHGFHATTVRDIATRARTNVAAGHYHYGSKRDLYLEVLREQFASTREMLRERGAAPPTAGERPPRAALEERLRLRVQVMLDVLIGPPPSLHGTLMCREMADPTEALPVIVDEFIRPMTAEMTAIVAQIEPGLTPAALERVVLSIIGQVVHWRVAMPALLLMRGERQYPKGLAATLADHITAFSLGGMRAVARARKGAARAR